MKKESTNLTVAVNIVVRARTIVAKAPLSPSVARLAEAILGQAFDAIESATETAQLPIITQLRAHIHGSKNALYTPDETQSARLAEPTPEEQRLTRLENAIDELRAQLSKKITIDPAQKPRKPKP